MLHNRIHKRTSTHKPVSYLIYDLQCYETKGVAPQASLYENPDSRISIQSEKYLAWNWSRLVLLLERDAQVCSLIESPPFMYTFEISAPQRNVSLEHVPPKWMFFSVVDNQHLFLLSFYLWKKVKQKSKRKHPSLGSGQNLVSWLNYAY